MNLDETKKCFECKKNMVQKDTGMASLSLPPQYTWIWWCFCGNTEEGGVRRGTSEADVNLEKWRQANQERELEPGSETDKLVAEAIGVECELRGLSEDPVKMTAFVKPNTIWSKFSPSTDLNDSFRAAEQTKKLFEINILPRGFCRVNVYPNNDEFKMISTSAKPPAIAICKAILKLKGGET